MCKHFIQWFLKNVINFFIIAEDLTISFKFMKLEIFVVSKWHVHDNWMNILHIYRLLWKGRKRNKLNNPRYKRLDEKREYPKRTIFPRVSSKRRGQIYVTISHGWRWKCSSFKLNETRWYTCWTSSAPEI